jgi:hypothetical protein
MLNLSKKIQLYCQVREELFSPKEPLKLSFKVQKKPPKLKGVDLIEVDPRLLKVEATSWVMAVIALVMIWTLGTIPSVTPVKKKKEMVVIYKRKLNKKTKKAEKVEKKEEKVAQKEAPKKKEKPKKIVKQPEPVKKKTPKKLVSKTKPKKKPEKVVKPKPAPKKLAKKIAPKPKKKVATTVKTPKKVVAVKKKPKKVYRFNIASKVKQNVGSSSNTLAKVKAETSYVTTMAEDARVDRALAAANVDAQGVSTSTFKSSEIGSLNNAVGAGSLAISKNGTETSYIETTTKVLGAIDPELIRKLLREHIPQFRFCYQRELNSGNESLRGVFDIMFKINASGKGNSVSLITKGKGFSKKGQDCIAKVIGMINFPRPKGGGVVDVRQPMNFLSNNRKI